MQVIERLQQYPGVKQGVDYLSSWIGHYSQNDVTAEGIPKNTSDTPNNTGSSDATTVQDDESNPPMANTEQRTDADPVAPLETGQCHTPNHEIATTCSDDDNDSRPVHDASTVNEASTVDSLSSNVSCEPVCAQGVSQYPRCTGCCTSDTDNAFVAPTVLLSCGDWSSASDSDSCNCVDGSEAMGRVGSNNNSRRKRASLQAKLFARRTKLLYDDFGCRGDTNGVAYVRRREPSLPRIDSVEEISMSDHLDDLLVVVQESDTDSDTVNIKLVRGGCDMDRALLSSGSLDLSSDWSEYTLSVASVGLECRESDTASTSCVSQDGQSHLDVLPVRRHSRHRPFQIGHAVNESFVDKECFHCVIL